MKDEIHTVTPFPIKTDGAGALNFETDRFCYSLSAQSSKKVKHFINLQYTNTAYLLQGEGLNLLTFTNKSTSTGLQSKTVAMCPEIELGELLMALFSRYECIKDKINSGLMFFLTGELYGCAGKLESYLLEMAHINQLEPEFLDWIENSNYFLDSYEYTLM